MFIFHIIWYPLITTNPEYSFDAFTCLNIKFCKLFYKKKHIIHFENELHKKASYLKILLEKKIIRKIETLDPYKCRK